MKVKHIVIDKKIFLVFLSIYSLLMDPQMKLRAFFISSFCGLLKFKAAIKGHEINTRSFGFIEIINHSEVQ